MYDLLILPFTEFLFLKRALMACIALSLGAAPIGVFLVLRRMSLMGDAISHSALPGVAIGYAISGLSLTAMSCGGLIAGLFVALSAGWVSRKTILKEDASLVGFYLIALAAGVIIVTMNGTKIDLMHILLGSILAINTDSLILVATVSTITLLTISLVFRAFILECFDPGFFRSIGGNGSIYHLLFIVLVVMNMVAALHAMGTLMALGLMMLPAITARLWVREVFHLCIVATVTAILGSVFGLLLSYHFGWPSGPAIILLTGGIYVVSLFIAPFGRIRLWGTLSS